MKKIFLLPALLFSALGTVYAQEKITITKDEENLIITKESGPQNTLSIGTEGVDIQTTKKERTVKFNYGGVDLGLNMLVHGTDYANPITQDFLNVPDNMKNDNLFSLKQGNSWNINIWLLMMKVRLVNQNNFKLNLNSGLGMQIYNFKYQKNILHINEINPEIILDEDRTHKKNKLSVLYASIPLKLNFQHRISKNNFLQYSFGVIGGINASTWTKTITREDGLQKNHDQFNLAPFNLNLLGEIGITQGVTLYATYQITNMYRGENSSTQPNALIQNPLSIGIKLTGF